MSEAFESTTSTESGPTTHRTIERTPGRTPLIGDYEERCKTFTWDEARQWIDGLPDGCLNIAHEAVDRHAAKGLADQVALRFLDRTHPTQELTYAELCELTDAFAIALRTVGVRPGERVSTLLNRSQALYVTALGTLKNGSVYCPLFPAFGPEPVRQRLALGSVRVLVTDSEAYERKVAPIRDSLTALEFILIVDDTSEGTLQAGAGEVDIARAAVRRRGTDVTLITYGGNLGKALTAADALAEEGLRAEVIDLRVLRPLDDETILASVRSTHRVVIIDEGWRTGSLSAEVAARIAEQAFYDLDAPIERVCAAEVPVPYAKHLEDAALPQPADIVAAARRAAAPDG